MAELPVTDAETDPSDATVRAYTVYSVPFLRPVRVVPEVHPLPTEYCTSRSLAFQPLPATAVAGVAISSVPEAP